MASKKSKNAQQQKKNKKGRSQAMVVRTRVPRSPGLDTASRRYAQLLADPCNGPLVSGPFGDGSGGIISRFEYDVVLGNSVTDAGIVFGFIPSAVASAFNSVPLVLDNTVYPLGTGYGPGQTYLSGGAEACRCLSACLQVFYPGSELSRQGIIGIGQCDARVFDTTLAGLSSTILRTTLQNVERMPAGYAEVIWRPNNYDITWQKPVDLSHLAQQTALAVSVYGIPASTGVRIRMVAVYEWQPTPANGLTTPLIATTPSKNTLHDVLGYLDSFGNWMYKSANGVGHAAASLYRGATRVGEVAYGVTKMAAIMAG